MSEFINKKFKKFCIKNDILLLHGKPRHPQASITLNVIIWQ